MTVPIEIEVKPGSDELMPAWFVGVYAVTREYGGPEEGGWWFDTGELIKHVVTSSEDDGRAWVDFLGREFPHTGQRYSMAGGDDYDICVSNEPCSDYFPTERPHYE